MSTYIAVMKLGVIQQLGTPDRVYHFPQNLFVADFIGNPKVNLIDGVIKGKDKVNLGKFEIAMPTHGTSGDIVVGIRPEDISISTKPVPGAVEFSAYSVLPSGAESTIIARLDDLEITVKEIGISKIKMDEKIWLKFDPDCINLYLKETGNLVSSENKSFHQLLVNNSERRRRIQ